MGENGRGTAMKPWKTIDRAVAPDGGALLLQERDGELAIRIGGAQLMSSRSHGSEEAMAQAALRGAAARTPRVLIGGLGMGYTLRAALDLLPRGARVVVAELLPPVVRWNRGPLAALSGNALDDPRVEIVEEDVGALMRRSPLGFDAILLDVDNGPTALSARSNRSLYSSAGIAWCAQALRPFGTWVVWSAGPDDAYLRRLREAGFWAEARPVKARAGGRAEHVLFLARRP